VTADVHASEEHNESHAPIMKRSSAERHEHQL
jgi:hypothetical protein